ncbi:prepilin-type N-terminal cleavage/methylation domain-containing protein [Opitutales bacterium]|nr:prepilin-type N-terminal cleavage/methylation domain-containing protein [Opitutales bacterium]
MDHLIKKKSSNKGFTLLEVVIALAVFGFLIGGLLGFLPWGVEGVGKVREQNIAYGLVDAVQVELERMGFSLVERGTKRILNISSPVPQDLADKRWSILLVAPKEGHRVEFEQVVQFNKTMMNDPDSQVEGFMQDRWENESDSSIVVFFNNYINRSDIPLSLVGMKGSETQPWSTRWIPEGERYFLIKCTQYPLEHRHRHHPSNGFLALQVDIQWPYKVPDPSKGDDGFRRISHRYRTHFRFPLAITR